MNADAVTAALQEAGFTLAGRSRGGERYHWPGDNHPRSASLFVPTDCYPEETRQYHAGLLAELRRAVDLGEAASAVLAAIEPAADSDDDAEVRAAWMVLAHRGLVRIDCRGAEPVPVMKVDDLLRVIVPGSDTKCPTCRSPGARPLLPARCQNPWHDEWEQANPRSSDRNVSENRTDKRD